MSLEVTDVGAAVPSGAAGPPVQPGASDHRVAMVLEVLAGETPEVVAARSAVDAELVRRWVAGFVEGGAAVVTNTPLVGAARERDRFLSAFAHELRTPLAVAQVWTETLRGDGVTPVLLTRGLTALEQALARLAVRVAEVELLASASLGRLVLERRWIDVRALVRPLPAPCTVHLGADAARVLVDPEKFRFVLAGLWKAALLGRDVRALRLETGLAPPWVEIRVVREGPPVPAEVLQALFEPFSVELANRDGRGLSTGLYLARALTIAHGGTIGLEQDEHQLTAWVRIPHVTEGAVPPTGSLPTSRPGSGGT